MKRALMTIGLGAGLMYLLDPENGERRRAQLRDKLRDLLPRTSDAIRTKADTVAAKANDLATRADDRAAEAIATLGPQPGDNVPNGNVPDAQPNPEQPL